MLLERHRYHPLGHVSKREFIGDLSERNRHTLIGYENGARGLDFLLHSLIVVLTIAAVVVQIVAIQFAIILILVLVTTFAEDRNSFASDAGLLRIGGQIHTKWQGDGF